MYFSRVVLAMAVGVCSVNCFASAACETKAKNAVAAMSGLDAKDLNIGELSEGEYTVSNATVGYVVSVYPRCQIMKVCKGAKSNQEICYDQE